ncbi:ABC transporter ATP-binding protein [Methylomonas sp. SURF-1]|uniref:ABC transporter ATP-binding protein n=1 Tax=Methylomonas aurea TaxID=2952224 RepID=A0ABT1UC23_9GAMM|nr:ABC transporter ATP-binding protein [Methylomonas sp. SURF-1]MCQ8179758.1 ABC transporter ATP-binding protein [Methylomonas sp. SURF-1]
MENLMNTIDSPLYSIRDVRFSYDFGNLKAPALNGVSLDIRQGDFICLTGPSGSGKTTLLNLLGLIEAVQDGDIHFNTNSLKTLTEREKNRVRRYQIGFVFQTFQLFPVLTAAENVEYFLTRQGIPTTERKNRVKDALAAVGILDQSDKKPAEMSGGQRQRVAIARAIAKRPRVIIADEPTANLDQATGKGVMEIFAKLNHDHQISLIISSHDPMVQSYSRHQVRLVDGKIC